MEQKKTLAASIFTFLGGVSGLISITLIIWQGGQLYQRVEDHGRRLDGIEQGGSIGLREHVKMDDERVADVRMRLQDQAVRLAHMEEVNAKLLEMGGELKVVNAKLDAMREQIKNKP